MCKCKYCGKELERSKIGGHTFACEKNPNYKKNINRSSIQFKNYNQKRRENTYYGNCLLCGAKLDKPNKKFCNSSCAAKYNNSKRKENGYTTKNKFKTVQCINCNQLFEVSIHCNKEDYYCLDCRAKLYKSFYKDDINKKICIVCGKEFDLPMTKSGRLSKYTTCSKECHKELAKKLGKETYQKRIENGTFKG